MKKTLCAMLALLLLLAAFPAFGEENDDDLKGFYLYERRLTPTEDGCMLQLRLYKEGGIQYCLDEPDVLLLDAAGNEIVPLTSRMIAPVNPVPAGNQHFPVTMIYTLPEGAEAADFRVLNVPGELYAEPSAEPLELHTGHILSHTKNGPAATCWLEKPETELRHSGHMMVLHVYDVEDNYLGTQAFSWEDADCIVPGTQACAKLAELSGLPVEVIDYYGLTFNERSEYYFFADKPLTCLLPDDIPATAHSDAYRTKSPLTVLASSFGELEDGRWRAYCLLQNGACEPIDFNGHHVFLYDAAGEAGFYSVMELDCALWELEAFGFTAMQYTFTGLPEDFVPAKITVSGKVVHEEAPYTVKVLPAEHYTVTAEEGKLLLDVTVPEELCGETLNYLEPPCAGLIWYARSPEDMSMISCGSVGHTEAGPMRTGSWFRYEDIEIGGIPEGVTPDVLVFVIDTK